MFVVGERSGVEWLGAGFCLCSCPLFLAPCSLLCSGDARLRTSVDWRRLAFPLGILRSQAVSSPSIRYLRCSLRRPFLRITGGSEFRSLRNEGDQEEEEEEEEDCGFIWPCLFCIRRKIWYCNVLIKRGARLSSVLAVRRLLGTPLLRRSVAYCAHPLWAQV